MWGPADFVQRRTLITGGVGDDQIRRRVRSGELVRLRRGSYAEGGAQVDATVDSVADYVRRVRAVADRSPHYIVGGLSAAALYGAPLWRADLSEVTLIRPNGTGSARTPGRRVRCSVLAPGDLARLHGVRITNPTRTMIDVARWCGWETAVVAADGLARKFPDAIPDDAALGRARNTAGIGAARAIVAGIDPRSESAGETLLRLMLLGGGLPAPDLQVEVYDESGKFVGRCDLGWPDHAVVLEFDGRIKYGSGDPAVLVAEKIREDRLRACGVVVVRFVWADFHDRAGLLTRAQRALVLGDRVVRHGGLTATFRPTSRWPQPAVPTVVPAD